MKTKLHKTLFLFALALFAFQAQVEAQAFSGDNTYRIKVQGEDLYLTLPDDDPVTSGSQILTYQPLDETTNRQVFTIQAVEGETNKYTITSVIEGKGVVEINDTSVTNPSMAVKGNAAGVAEMLDWWNPTRGSGTQLFSENDSPAYDGVSKRRVQNTLQGADLTNTEVKLSGGSPLALDYVVATVLSNEEFDLSNVTIKNPVKEELSIEGLTDNISKISIYSLVGQRVMFNNVSDYQTSIQMDVSSLNSGIYIMKLEGENNSSFSKKIVKR